MAIKRSKHDIYVSTQQFRELQEVYDRLLAKNARLTDEIIDYKNTITSLKIEIRELKKLLRLKKSLYNAKKV